MMLPSQVRGRIAFKFRVGEGGVGESRQDAVERYESTIGDFAGNRKTKLGIVGHRLQWVPT